MYVSATFACLLRGRSMPAIRAINSCSLSFCGWRAATALVPTSHELTASSGYPCRCLCFEFSQITRTTPLRWMTLHLSQIFFTDALTFTETVLGRWWLANQHYL